MHEHNTTLDSAAQALDHAASVGRTPQWTLDRHSSAYRVTVFLTPLYSGLPGVYTRDHAEGTGKAVWVWAPEADTALGAVNAALTMLAALGTLLSQAAA